MDLLNDSSDKKYSAMSTLDDEQINFLRSEMETVQKEEEKVEVQKVKTDADYRPDEMIKCHSVFPGVLYFSGKHTGMSNAGDSYMMNNFFDFDINQFDTMMAKVQAYRTFIENQRKDYEARTGHSGAYDKTDKKYWTQASSAMGQITKIQNEIKASNDGSSLENLFGKTDLTEVISGLNQIVVKLDEIVNSAKDLKTAFADGLKIEAATADVTELTNKVKALEEELSKLKSVKSPTSQNTSSSQKNQNPTKGNSQAYNEQIQRFNFLHFRTKRSSRHYGFRKW